MTTHAAPREPRRSGRLAATLAAAALAAAVEEQQPLLLDGVLDDAILTLDPGGRVTTWGTGAERLTGYTEKQILGQPFECLFRPADVDDGVPVRILAHAAVLGRAEAAGPRMRRDGTMFWASTVVTATLAEDGAVSGFVQVMCDETARHDVGRQVPELPLEAGRPGPTRRRMLDVVDTNGARLLSLVEDLLSFAKVDAGDFAPVVEPVDVADMLARIDAIVRTALPPNLHLALSTPPDMSLVAADPAHLNRALLSLLSNAVKFSPGGGTVTLGCEHDAHEVRVFVADTGIGIPDVDQARLFQRFFRSSRAPEQHTDGTGLGLALVKTIAEAHNGRVTLWSEPDAGTRVTLHLPRAVA
jgi:PAS domain S-box-containing protein